MTFAQRIVGLCLLGSLAAGCNGTSPPPDDAATMNQPDMGTAGMDAFVVHDAWMQPPPVDAGPMCMGTAPACDAVTTATECNAILGCGYGQCAGMAPDCHHLVTMATCMALTGCMWDGICRGTASPCASYTDMASCTAQSTCMWGATSTCSGASTMCQALTFSQCLTQPGCAFEPADAFVGPRDAFVPPPDANCMTGGGSTTVVVHTIEPDLTAGGVHALAGVHVLAESVCGGASMELVTDAGGDLSVMLSDAGAPWTLTFAKAGYVASSLVDVTHLGTIGDVRLDPLVLGGTMTNYAASGTVTGPGAASAIFQVDAPDFDTMRTTVGSRTFSSQFSVGFEHPEPPLQFVALELDATGHAINLGSAPSMARPSAPVTGVSIAMASPALTPVVTHVRLHLPTTGLTSPPSATTIDPQHAYLNLPNAPFVITGTSVLTPIAGDPANLDLAITHFAGALDVNLTAVRVLGSVALLNVVVTDIRDQDITVAPVTALSSHGSSLADLGASGAGTGYDVLMIDVGESDMERPHWRVFAAATSGTADIVSMPHLPAGVTLADIGLVGSTTYIPLLVHMQTGHAWATQAENHPSPEFGWSVGTQYFPITATGR